MDSNLRHWSLAFLKDGKRTSSIPLVEEVTSLGRDASNTVQLPDASISRVHAELREVDAGVEIRDCQSRNGLKVNGAPRRKAVLQAGDVVDVGIYRFELLAGTVPKPAKAPFSEVPHVPLDVTAIRHTPLAVAPEERLLHTLAHVCYWVTEEIEPREALPGLLELLREGFNVREVHYYTAKAELQATACAPGEKAKLKLAPFLAERCQTLPEATIVTGTEVRRHQQKVGNFNYLVGPLRHPGDPSAKMPFILLVRPDDWVDFDARDKVLLQAICQLWVRGQGKVQQVQSLRRENAILKQKTETAPLLLGESDSMDKLRARLAKVAGTKATVLITGETGSGKEVVAHYLHQRSPRAEAPFVKLNCAAMPDGLIESELFGHVKGAFTDAKAHHDGKFVQANSGTLFLDEIGEMPLTVQAKLLRAIESGEVEPVGSEKTKQVDVRIVAATHRDLAAMVEARQFRQDLFFRLNVVAVSVPALREHPDDIPILAGEFLATFCAENGLANLTFSKKALAELKTHPWPGNVRELRNVVQRSAIEAAAATISGEDIAEALK